VWPRRSDALFIGLSTTQVAWQFAGSAAHVGSVSVPRVQFDQVVAMIESPSMPSRVPDIHMVAGGSVARHWLQTAPPGLRSLSELQAFVKSRADQLFGGDPGWVVAADWHATRPFLCAALPGGIERLASAMAIAKRATSHLATTLTLALAQHARNFPADGWAVLHEPEALHLMYISAGKLEYFRTAVVPVGLEALALEDEVGAEVARSSALAGGLPTGPLTILPMNQDPGATQANAALKRAMRLGGAPKP